MSDIEKTSTAYYIALSSAIGTANKCTPKILYNFGSARNFIESGFDAWKSVGLHKSRIDKLKSAEADIERAEKIMDYCAKKGYKIITVESPEYPERLKRIPDFPLVLYIDGTLPQIDDEVAIAVVGTRNASNYGTKVAHIISSGLVKGGAMIVSGGAMGIDSVAHKAALINGAKTVAVLGGGFDSGYLVSNKELRKEITKNGAVITEFEPGLKASKFTFPVRNRIISGLCLGTVVIEAGIKSGSLITAEHALEQGRDVFAAPGSVISPSFEGTNKFLREGAKPVFSAVDVLEEYTNLYPHKINLNNIPPLATDLDKYHTERNKEKEQKQKQKTNKITANENKTDFDLDEQIPTKPKVKKVLIEGVSEGAKIVYEKLTFEPTLFDDLLITTDLDTDILARSLTELEIYGMIESTSGNKYVIKSE
jgi:DNA processing protein